MIAKSPRQQKTERFGSETFVRVGTTRKDRKRSEIVAAAKAVFFKEGYAGASMDQITAQAGVSKATIYSHFRSKEELLRAVVDDVLDPIRAAMSELPSTENFREWLAQLGCKVGRQVTSGDAIALTRLAAAEALRFPEIAQAVHSNGIAVVEELIRPRIEAAIARGAIKPCQASVAVTHLLEMCFGRTSREVLMGLRPAPSAKQIEDDVRLAVDVFMDGYAVR